jgi:AraC-like DNA-binding protein
MIMGKQIFRPNISSVDEVNIIRTMGVDSSDCINQRGGKDWVRWQVCRQEFFSLVAVDQRMAADVISYTRQQDYIKVNFWLSGRHTSILDGFGQIDHDGPEVFLTSTPWETLKVDVLSRSSATALVAVCLVKEFFPTHMGIEADDLPEPLRALLAPEEKPYGFCRYRMTPDLVAATRAVLAAPFAVRRDPIYVQAKSVELMCLLINQMTSQTRAPKKGILEGSRQEARLFEVREMLSKRFAEAITLERIAKEVGINRMALTSGFRQLFGMSVHDCLRKHRMERAYELLQDNAYSIGQVAVNVGYNHACNFSTAFHDHFGFSPQKVRGARR